MILFKFPQKKIVLDCFTDSEITIKAAPVDLAIKHMPDWWKELPASYMTELTQLGTMKGCMGMIDFYKYSVAIPLWSDLALLIKNKDYKWQFADTATNAQVHNLEIQATGFMPKDYGHLKIASPWVFSCKENVNWVWSTPLYNLNENPDIVILPGIVNYHSQGTTDINMFFDVSKDRQILIKLGTPLAIITPMSDRKVEVVRHLISTEEYVNKVKNNIAFLRKYEKVKELTDKFKSCPFHNHIGKN